MSTSSVYAYTHSVTYVTDQILRSLKKIICWIGLNPNKFVGSWDSTDLAIKTWLHSGDLRAAVLEIYNSNTGALASRWEFTIDYNYEYEDVVSMWLDAEAIRSAIRKCGTLPSYCDYRVVLTTNRNRPDVPGWGATTLLSTDGFVKQSIGTTIGTFALGAQAGYWRKK